MEPLISLDWLATGWAPVRRVLIVGVLGYVALILMLRISGKRTLSKLNAFDLIVTVALGSTLATILVSETLSLATGLTALAVLIALQYAVTRTSVLWPAFSQAVRSEPALLLRSGRPLDEALRRERVTRDELLAAVRSGGGEAFEAAEAVFLESDGTLTTLLKPPAERGAPAQARAQP